MPRTFTIEKTVYKYNELSEKQKEKAIEKLYDINVDGDFWYDYDGKTGFSQDEIDYMYAHGLDRKHKIPDELIEHKKLYFSIDRSWYIDFHDGVISDNEILRAFCGVPKRAWCLMEYNLYTPRYIDSTTKIEFSYIGNKAKTPDNIQKYIDQAEERVNDKIQQALIDLQKNYEYLTSREAIEETIEANEYEFDENGNIA
jgi:hypothetical protein